MSRYGGGQIIMSTMGLLIAAVGIVSCTPTDSRESTDPQSAIVEAEGTATPFPTMDPASDSRFPYPHEISGEFDVMEEGKFTPILVESEAISTTVEHMVSAGFTVTNVTARLLSYGNAMAALYGYPAEPEDPMYPVWLVGFSSSRLETSDIVPLFNGTGPLAENTPTPEVSDSGYVLWDAGSGTQISGGLLELNKPLTVGTLRAIASESLSIHTPTPIPTVP